MPIYLKCLQMGTRGKCTFGGKGYPTCPEGIPPSALCPFTLNVYKWALEQMGTWVKCTFGERGTSRALKGYPQVPYAHFPQMYVNGHWGKWALGVNAHLGERGTPSALCPFISNVGHWGHLGKRAPQVSCTHFPQFFQMGSGENGPWGPKCPFAPVLILP